MLKVLLNTLIVGFAFSASAQDDVKIVHISDLNTDISGTTIEVTGDPSDPTIYHDMRVVNLSGQTINMAFKRVRLANSGRVDQICDNNLCYNADDQMEYTTPSPAAIDDQDTSIFKPQIVPAGNESCGIHDYYVVNSFGIVYDSIRIKFRTTNSNCFLNLEEESADLNEFNVYPNPAQNVLNIENLTFNEGSVVIYDALGKEVLKEDLNDEISLASIKNGLYFVHVLNNKGVLSDPKKLIVRK